MNEKIIAAILAGLVALFSLILPVQAAFVHSGEVFLGKYAGTDKAELGCVHINRNARISGRIFRRTRRKFADVLYVLQEFSTKLCGKSVGRRALSVNVNTP